jgi:hypothetical protein
MIASGSILDDRSHRFKRLTDGSKLLCLSAGQFFADLLEASNEFGSFSRSPQRWQISAATRTTAVFTPPPQWPRA